MKLNLTPLILIIFAIGCSDAKQKEAIPNIDVEENLSIGIDICRDISVAKESEYSLLYVDHCLNTYYEKDHSDFKLSKITSVPGDINNDGLTDLFVYYNSLECGSGGCGGDIYIATQEGFCSINIEGYMGVTLDLIKKRFNKEIKVQKCKPLQQ